jgi:hypothetical protein
MTATCTVTMGMSLRPLSVLLADCVQDASAHCSALQLDEHDSKTNQNNQSEAEKAIPDKIDEAFSTSHLTIAFHI